MKLNYEGKERKGDDVMTMGNYENKSDISICTKSTKKAFLKRIKEAGEKRDEGSKATGS